MDPTSTSTMPANVKVKMDTQLVTASKTNYVKGSWIGKNISNLQSKMYDELREYTLNGNSLILYEGLKVTYNYKPSCHILGWFVGAADVGLDIIKYPLLTIEHLAKAILEPFGVIIKMGSKGRICESCTLGSAVSHLGFGIKGALSTAFIPLFILRYAGNIVSTARKPGHCISLWERTKCENKEMKKNIKKGYNLTQ